MQAELIFWPIVVVLCFAQVGNSVSTILSIFNSASLVSHLIAVALGMFAGFGLFLIYVPDFKSYLIDMFSSDKDKTMYKILNDIKSKKTSPKVKSVGYKFVNAFGYINAFTANFVNNLVGGALLLLSLFSLFKIQISVPFLLVLSVCFGIAGIAAAMTTTRIALLDVYEKPQFDKKSLVALPVVLAAVGNAFWSGLHLLDKLGKVFGAHTKIGLCLLRAPHWVAVIIASICACITFFAAGALYLKSIGNKMQEYTSFDKIKQDIVSCGIKNVVVLLAAGSLTVIYAYRLDFLLKMTMPVHFATGSAIFCGLFMFVMFATIMINKMNTFNIDHAFAFAFPFKIEGTELEFKGGVWHVPPDTATTFSLTSLSK